MKILDVKPFRHVTPIHASLPALEFVHGHFHCNLLPTSSSLFVFPVDRVLIFIPLLRLQLHPVDAQSFAGAVLRVSASHLGEIDRVK